MQKTYPDATKHHNPASAQDLIARAANAVGSRNKLTVVAGMSRRKINYLEAGKRTLPSGKTIDVTMTFAEQVLMESIARSRE